MVPHVGVLILTLLCALSHARYSLLSQSLDTDLDSVLCAATQHPGYIIDIHESMAKGAELLNGIWSDDVNKCSSSCCQTDGCDLALYKKDGVSKTGKNCYLVQCRELANCVMVEHVAFTSVTFQQGNKFSVVENYTVLLWCNGPYFIWYLKPEPYYIHTRVYMYTSWTVFLGFSHEV